MTEFRGSLRRMGVRCHGCRRRRRDRYEAAAAAKDRRACFRKELIDAEDARHRPAVLRQGEQAELRRAARPLAEVPSSRTEHRRGGVARAGEDPMHERAFVPVHLVDIAAGQFVAQDVDLAGAGQPIAHAERNGLEVADHDRRDQPGDLGRIDVGRPGQASTHPLAFPIGQHLAYEGRADRLDALIDCIGGGLFRHNEAILSRTTPACQPCGLSILRGRSYGGRSCGGRTLPQANPDCECVTLSHGSGDGTHDAAIDPQGCAVGGRRLRRSDITTMLATSSTVANRCSREDGRCA